MSLIQAPVKYKERPILFNADMVRAIRDGHKTQTRRILDIEHPAVTGFVPNGRHYWRGTAKSDKVIQQYISTFPYTVKCPFGVVGDQLWVRETFAVYGDEEMHTIHYRADHPEHEGRKGMGYKPSFHMPRWASRLLLEITDIRVERLNAISKEDVAKEWKGIYGEDSWTKNPWVWVVEFKVLARGMGVKNPYKKEVKK